MSQTEHREACSHWHDSGMIHFVLQMEPKLKSRQPWFQRILVLSLIHFGAGRAGAYCVASLIRLEEGINPCLTGQGERPHSACEHGKEL